VRFKFYWVTDCVTSLFFFLYYCFKCKTAFLTLFYTRIALRCRAYAFGSLWCSGRSDGWWTWLLSTDRPNFFFPADLGFLHCQEDFDTRSLIYAVKLERVANTALAGRKDAVQRRL
jgi:hypothetical protein